MARSTNAVASRRRRKRLLKRAEGFVGDRKNHVRLSSDAVMKAMAFSTAHRRKRKGDFRRLWIVRIGIAAKARGISYSRFINGLVKLGCHINRKMLSDMAIRDPEGLAAIIDKAKQALVSVG